MRVEILCVTHLKDLDFLQFMLRSYVKFAKGFTGLTVVVPEHELTDFKTEVRPWVTLKSYPEIAGKGMIQHEAEILRADIWCPKAEAILHMDADCIFTRPVTPLNYLCVNDPFLYREKFENFRHIHPTRYGWRKAVNAATGIYPEWETMVRHPAIHHARVYSVTRCVISSHTGMDFYDYVLSCRNEYPQTFAEFPTLGAVAIKHFRSFYELCDFDGEGKDYTYRNSIDHIISFWSHGGLDAVCDRDMEYPGGNALGKTPRQVFEELGL